MTSAENYLYNRKPREETEMHSDNGDPIPVGIVSNREAKVPHRTEEVLVHA